MSSSNPKAEAGCPVAPTFALLILCGTGWLWLPRLSGQEKHDVKQIAAAPVENVTFADVRTAIRDLDANELRTRDEAEKRLVDMGPAVLSFLPEITPRTSGEMKIRLQRLRQSLQHSKIESYFEASEVSIHGRMQLAQAIAQISKQTGNQIRIDGSQGMPDVEVELEADKEPFWTVMGKLMSQASLRINAYGATEGELVLSPGAADKSSTAAVFSSGPFRLETVSVKSILPFASAIGGQLELSFLVTWEPRLKPVFMQLPMASVKAALSSGNSLSASSPQAVPEVPLNLGGCSTQIDLQLQRPSRSEQKIERLSGEFTIAVPSERHEYIFQKFGDGARQSEKYGDVTVTLEGSRRNGAVYEMRIFVEFGDPQGALDSFRGWILSNEAYLRDAKQTRLENVGLNTYAITPNAVGIAYLFQINGDPDDYKLIYESPAAITKQKVLYELEDIDLP